MGLRWAWRSWRIGRAIGMTATEARAALAAWTPPEQVPDVQPVTSSVFDPRNRLWGFYPLNSAASFNTLVYGSSGQQVGYMQGVLYWCANQPCRPPAAPGPYNFGPTTANCVRSFNRFFGIGDTATCNVQTWGAIQWLVWNT
jgi:hypothetical protein